MALIEILQRRGADLASPAYPPYQVAFDMEKFLWELEFFTKHFIEGYRGVAIDPAAHDALTRRVAQPGGPAGAQSRACSAIAIITAAI